MLEHAAYLLASLLFIALWIIMYFYRQDLRREMRVMSTLVAILGLYLEAFVWTKDWWKPPTITRTLIGIEDFLFGFAMGGITAVLYEEVFKEKLVFRKKIDHRHTKEVIVIFLLSSLVSHYLFFLMRIHSFYVSMIAMLIPTIYIYFRRHDLIIDSITTGLTITIISIPAYLLMEVIAPGYVYRWWFLDKLSGILFLGIPIEDLIWFFGVGLLIGPVYIFWQGGKLQHILK